MKKEKLSEVISDKFSPVCDTDDVKTPVDGKELPDPVQVKGLSLQEVLDKFGEDDAFVSKYTEEDYKKAFDEVEKFSIAAKSASGGPRAKDQLRNVCYAKADIFKNIYREYEFQRRMITDMGNELDALYAQIRRSDKEYSDLNRMYKELVGKYKEAIGETSKE